MCDLKGKVALVSGAGQGIGARTADVLAEAGAVVIVLMASVGCFVTGVAGAQERPSTATISACEFSNGVTIAPCRIDYRTFGTLNAAKDNAVLVPTWLLGRSAEWAPFLGPSGVVNTDLYYVIVVDALGDGQSQSPSNTAADSRFGFEALTIGDMVQSQYRLLTEKLGINKLHAVVGVSMGGMQAIEWAVRYPTFASHVIAIAGTPRFGSYDHLLWTTMGATIDDGLQGGLSPDAIWLQLTRLDALNARTPSAVNQATPSDVDKEVTASARTYRGAWALEDYRAQIGAVLRQDVSAAYGGDLAKAAARVRSKMLLIYSWDDHMVTAEEVSAFGRLVGAETLEVPSPCGHLMAVCEMDRVGSAIREFLAR